MSLADIQAPNTQKVRTTTINVFQRYLEEESVTIVAVTHAVREDLSGKVLTAVGDSFGIYLAYLESSSGKKLSRNTVMQYFRQTKNWLLECFPHCRANIESVLLSKGQILERYCKKRPSGSLVKQAAACSKQDLYSIMNYLYANATAPSDCQDLALVALLRFLFGRASDLTLFQKKNLSICGGNVFFVRFVRMKTSEEQGLSLFPDACLETCSTTALAVALVLQTTPNSSLLPHLPAATDIDIDAGPLVALSEILSGATLNRNLLEEPSFSTPSGKPSPQAVPGIHSYINRVLQRVFKPAGVTVSLTSHSFRRGGAQAANGDADLTLQWIVDRGGWNMSTTSKAFQYIFNTTKEDQKVAKVLAGWNPKAPVHLLDFSSFDILTRQKLDAVKTDLFGCCSGLQENAYNVNAQVTDILCAYLIKAYPYLKSLRKTSRLVFRVEQALKNAGVAYEELLAWSVHLSQHTAAPIAMTDEKLDKYLELMYHQAAVIDELIEVNKSLSIRVRDVEAELRKEPKKRPATESHHNDQVSCEEVKPIKKRKAQAQTLSTSGTGGSRQLRTTRRSLIGKRSQTCACW